MPRRTEEKLYLKGKLFKRVVSSKMSQSSKSVWGNVISAMLDTITTPGATTTLA